MRYSVVPLIFGLAASGATAGNPARAAEANDRPVPLTNQLQGVRIDQKLGKSVPLEERFRDENGREVKLSQFFDGRRPVILTLVYFRCPMLCTLVLNDTLRAIRAMSGLELGRDYQILSVSFNPREGSELAAAKKDHYVAEYCRGLHFNREVAQGGWHFLTGDEASIDALTESVGFHYRWDEKFQQYAHPSGLILLTPGGRITRYLFGIGYQPNDLRLSLVESSHNKIGGLAEQFLLGCFHYDPSRGRYSLAVMKALRAGGVLILFALGALFWILSRYNRRRRASVLAGERHAVLDN